MWKYYTFRQIERMKKIYRPDTLLFFDLLLSFEGEKKKSVIKRVKSNRKLSYVYASNMDLSIDTRQEASNNFFFRVIYIYILSMYMLWISLKTFLAADANSTPSNWEHHKQRESVQ